MARADIAPIFVSRQTAAAMLKARASSKASPHV